MATPLTPQAPGSAAGTTPPEQPVTPTEQPEKPKEQRFVTEDQLVDAVEKGVRRAQQSAADRTRKVQDQVTAMTAQLQAIGVKVTPEIERNVQQQAAQAVDQLSTQPQQQAAQQTGDEPGEGNEIFDWTMAFYKEEGITVDKADPEYKEIRAALDDPKGTPVKYQKTVMKSVEAKRARLETEKEGADARVLGGGTDKTNALGPDVNPHDLFQDAHRS